MVALFALVRLLSSVNEQMRPQMSSLTEWFITLRTFVQLHSTVGQQVSFQLIIKTKSFALCSFMRPKFGMCQGMSFQMLGMIKWFVTLCTFVQFHTSVDQQMSPQISSLTEWFVALYTFVRLLTSVGENVIHQNILITKCLVALCTFVHILSILSQEVPSETSSLTEELSAVNKRLGWFYLHLH